MKCLKVEILQDHVQALLILLLGLIDLIRSKARVLYQKGQIKTKAYEKDIINSLYNVGCDTYGYG